MADARRVRDGRHGTRVTFSPEGVHPAHDAVPRQLRLLHVRPAPGPPRPALPRRRRRCWRSPAGAPPPVATRRCSRWASGPSCATRWPGAGWPSGATTRRVHYLPEMAALVLTETGLLPHANAGALHRDELAGPAAGQPQPGDDDRVAEPRPRLPPGRAGQGTRAAPGHARARRRAGHPLHHRHPVRHRRIPPGPHRGAGGHRRQPSPPRPRAGGDRPELPAQAAHGHVPGRRLPAGRVPVVDRRRPPDPAGRRSTCRPRPTCPTTSACCSTPASTTGAASPRSPPTTSTPNGPGPSSTGCARSPRPGASPSLPVSPIYPSSPSSPTGGSISTCTSGCMDRSDAEGMGRDDPGRGVAGEGDRGRRGAGRRRGRAGRAPLDAVVLGVEQPAAGARARPSPAGASSRGPVAEVLAGVAPARRSARTRSSRCSRPAAPEVTEVAEVADELRRQADGDVVTWVPQPEHQLHERVHVQVPVLRLLEGPAVAEPAGHALPADARRHRRAGAGGLGPGRHRGDAAGRHPPRLRRRLLPRRRPGREGRRCPTCTCTASPPSR